MDFIERWFHVSPDGGSGATEIVYVVALVVIVALLASRRRLAALVRRFRDDRNRS